MPAPTETAARQNADTLSRLYDLASKPGGAPEQRAARQQVIELFFQHHLPAKSPADVAAYLARIDLAKPVAMVDASKKDASLQVGGFLAGTQKPTYLVGEQYKPAKSDDPLYALRSIPLAGSDLLASAAP